MHAYWIILVFCSLSIATLKAAKICDKLSVELAAEFDKCNDLDPDNIKSIIRSCKADVLLKEVYPYLLAGCNDSSITRKVNQCLSEKLADVTDEEMAGSTACYDEVGKKYDIDV
ncbi:uncharacterized protein [Parasteatoda tepidariorum]|uniref:uncharacterized protein n=1 Tax=Parasteatoda tepidariorum TaxID=114398 RepID=UPI001C725EAB|nr:uncharacterized protein LOC107442342 isoform X1 [Parasteatoda tepidariorum]